MERRTDEALRGRDGLSARWLWAAFAVSCALMFSRWPALFLHAQFYAEDGKMWYAQAYNGGWLRSLAIEDAGYLNTIQRLGTGVALLFPLRDGPLVDAVIGLLLQAWPVPILLSSRCSRWAPLPVRVLFAAIYVAIPDGREIHVDLGNSQWHLAMVDVLLAMGTVPRTVARRVLEAMLFLISGFCGPFCLLFLPVLGVFWRVRRQGWTLVVAGCMGVGSVVQVWLLLHSEGRSLGPLGASMASFLRFVGEHIVRGALLGGYGYRPLTPMVLVVPAVLFGLLVWGLCLWTATLELRLFIAYSALLLAAALRSPAIVGDAPRWVMLLSDPGARYWFLGSLTLLWSAAWCWRCGQARWVRRLGAGVLLVTLFGVVYSWRYEPFADEDFAGSVARWERAAPGEWVVIPITPQGWTMELHKR